MHIRYMLLLGLISLRAHAIISLKPICSIYTPNSILEHKEQYKPLSIGPNRKRYATCTGAVWFHKEYLAVLNLYGERLISYIFNEETKTFTQIQQIDNTQGACFSWPEQLAVSPDGTLLAVCNSKISEILFYTIDVKTHLIEPKPIFVLKCIGLIHNVRFTSDGRYFAYGSFDYDASICIYELMHNAGSVQLHLVYKQQSDRSKQLRAKGINFTQDSRYAVVAYGMSICDADKKMQRNEQVLSIIETYPFTQGGSLGEVISSITFEGVATLEDVAFLHNDTAVIVTDQTNDRLYICPFDATTGKLEHDYVVMQNPEMLLDFPHGMGVCQDGIYLVVTNYGDDKCNIYQIDSTSYLMAEYIGL